MLKSGVRETSTNTVNLMLSEPTEMLTSCVYFSYVSWSDLNITHEKQEKTRAVVTLTSLPYS